MIFLHFEWLAVGLAACLGMFWTWRLHDARQRKALASFVSAHLSSELTRSISGARRRLKRVLFTAAVALLFVALAEPQAGFHWEQVKRRGNDIVFAVDTSRSMLTPDVKPNRLVRAKLAIDDFVSRLGGDAVGLVAFAGNAFLQCPLTLDYGAFQESLEALDTRIIPRGGTDISSAIRAAQSALRDRAGTDKLLILVTDGEDLEGNALETAKTAYRQDGLRIYTVGVGSANGDLIPLPADQGGGFLKDSDGRFVRSRLDETALRALAQATGGSYSPLGTSNQGLDAIYRQAIAPLAKRDLESRSEKVHIERYQWPLAACLGFLLASILVGTRRRVRAHASVVPQAGAAGSAGAAGVLIALLSLTAAHPAHASPGSAASAYQRGDFSAAQRDYSAAAARDPAQPILKFNAGTAAYKAGDFPGAAREFQASLDAAKSGSAKRLAEQQDAFYNLGNTLYRQGQKTQQDDAQKTIAAWTQAVHAYDAALQLRADDPDSKFNRELVSKKLEQLKKQRQNQDKQSQNKQDKDKQDKDKQPQDKQGKDQQGKNQQPQDKSEGQDKDSTERSGSNGPSPSPPQKNNAAPSGGSQGQEPQPQPQPGQQPAQAQSQAGQTQRSADQGPEQGEARVSGEMSPEEARELLDSVKDEERRAPSAQNSGQHAGPQLPSRDW